MVALVGVEVKGFVMERLWILFLYISWVAAEFRYHVTLDQHGSTTIYSRCEP